jgi:hypothetical protein
MELIKINREIQAKIRDGSSNLYERFRPYFDIMTSADNKHFNYSNFDFWYIKNSEIEFKLNAIRTSEINSIDVLVGATGIGKSTLIQKVFNYTNAPKFEKGILTIPFYLNGTKTNDLERSISQKIEVACEVVIKALDLKLPASKLFEFISTHRPEIPNDISLKRNASAAKKMENLRNKEPYKYYAEELKYISQEGEIRSIEIILDDIESESYDSQRKILQSFLKLRTCLCNFGDQARTYTVHLILACRQNSYKKIVHDDSLSAWRVDVNTQIELEKPCDLATLFECRLNAIIESIGQGKKIFRNQNEDDNVNNIDKWKSSKDTLISICNKFANKFANEIFSLCNFNIPLSLKTLTIILENSRWFEYNKTDSEQGGFTLEESNYRNTEAGFLRALALGQSNIFNTSAISRHFKHIHNIFRNSQDNSDTLMQAYIFAFIVFRAKNQGDTFLEISKSEIVSFLECFYDSPTILRQLNNILNNMITCNFVRKEIEVFDLKNSADGNTQETYIPMYKLYAHYRMLTRSCIYLEFCRDDTYITESDLVTQQIANRLSTSELSGENLFLSILDFIESILDNEITIWNRTIAQEVCDRAKIFVDPFMLSSDCLQGFKKSLGAYFKQYPISNFLENRIVSIVNKIDQQKIKFNVIQQKVTLSEV